MFAIDTDIEEYDDNVIGKAEDEALVTALKALAEIARGGNGEMRSDRIDAAGTLLRYFQG